MSHVIAGKFHLARRQGTCVEQSSAESDVNICSELQETCDLAAATGRIQGQLGTSQGSVQCSAVQCSEVQCSAVQCSVGHVQHCCQCREFRILAKGDPRITGRGKRWKLKANNNTNNNTKTNTTNNTNNITYINIILILIIILKLILMLIILITKQKNVY